jgi:putative hemolysin
MFGQELPPEMTDPNLDWIGNPAYENCIKLSGTSETRTDAQGNETGYCHLPDGRVCEEWALFDGKCPPKGPGPLTGGCASMPGGCWLHPLLWGLGIAAVGTVLYFAFRKK